MDPTLLPALSRGTAPSSIPGLRPEAHDAIVRQVNPLEDPAWGAAVTSLPGATIFHTAAWARVLFEAYGYRPIGFLAGHRPDAPRAAVPLMEIDSWLTGRRAVSLPFTDECAPLQADAAALAPILDVISALGRARHWRCWELRGNPLAATPASVAFHGHRLALHSDAPELFARCDSATRRAVRKAGNSGLTVTFSCDLESLRTFYRLFCQTRKRLGLPPPPWRFFAGIHRHILAAGHGVVVLARRGDVPVAGAVFLHFAGAALFKFGASDHAFQHLRANNLVMWRAIEWHARAGFHSLDFGRTSLGNEGLRRFKLGWGPAERRIEYSTFDHRSSRYITTLDRSSGWHNRFFRLLPGAFARILGAVVYKHIA
jgi:hypothetical protein